MFGSILNRLIFWELVKVFTLALGSLTGLFLLILAAQQAQQLGLGAGQILEVLPLLAPSTFPYTIPATTLFASCVVYGRLAHDNEVVAIKAAGVRLFVILKPAILLGLLTTAITAGLYHTVIPRTQQMLQETVLRDPEEVMYNALKRDRCFRHPSFPYTIYVKDVQGRRLIDVVIKQRSKGKDGKGPGAAAADAYETVARAREARLRVDAEKGAMFIDADRFVMFQKTTRGTTSTSRPFEIDLPDSLSGKEAKSRLQTLTWDDLGPRVAVLQGELDDVRAKREQARRAAEALPDGPMKQSARDQDRHYKALEDGARRMVRNVTAEYYMRPALAVGCLCFAVIGCPVGLWANRADYLSTFVICFLPAMFIYYPLLLAGSNMGKDGKLPLGVGVFLANIVVGGLGALLSYRLLRR